MALTITPKRCYVTGDRRTVVAEVTFDSSYPTGGESLTAADLGLELGMDQIEIGGASSTGHVFQYDWATSKLKAFRPNAHTHSENAAATYTQSVNTGSAGGQTLTEEANATNLSTTVVRVVAVGKGRGLFA